jgi:hypothetical protein
LFQKQLDRSWFAGRCAHGLDIDTNIQNPARAGIGAWNLSGVSDVETARTRAVYDGRYIALRNTTVLAEATDASGPTHSQICYAKKPVTQRVIGAHRIVRVLRRAGSFLAVDLDEDGVVDGYCLATDLAADVTKIAKGMSAL